MRYIFLLAIVFVVGCKTMPEQTLAEELTARKIPCQYPDGSYGVKVFTNDGLVVCFPKEKN